MELYYNNPANARQTEEFIMEKYVESTTLIGQIVREYPEAIEVLLASGMHCLGCPASQAESIADACMVHGIDADELLEAVNNAIAEARK